MTTTEPLKAEDVPELEGWVPLANAASRMKMSPNGLRKRVFDYNEFGGIKNVRRIVIGTNVIYLLRASQVDIAVEQELADREEYQNNRRPRIELRKAKKQQRQRIAAWAAENGFADKDNPAPLLGRLSKKLLDAYTEATGDALIE